MVFVFVDMESSGLLQHNLAQQIDEDAYQRVRQEQDSIVSEVIASDGAGEIIKSTGDGVLAVLREPSTAVERALEIQRLLHGHPLIRVRVGIDVGQVDVESTGGVKKDMFGRHVHWAARAMSFAEGGHICVTAPVFVDAYGWIPKSRVAWKKHGYYRPKPGEPPIQIYEPFNANFTQPMEALRGESVGMRDLLLRLLGDEEVQSLLDRKLPDVGIGLFE